LYGQSALKRLFERPKTALKERETKAIYIIKKIWNEEIA
jgi:hypothetical protein